MKKNQKYLWNDNPHYKKWVLARDKALEVLHTRAQLESSDVLRNILTVVMYQCKAHFHAIKSNPQHIDSLDKDLKLTFHQGANFLYDVITNLRAQAYTLSKSSENEIIAQLLNKKIHNTLTKSQIFDIKHGDSFAAEYLLNRIQHYMDRLRRKLVTFAQGAALVAKSEQDFLLDVLSAMPKHRTVIVPRRILKPKLLEAKDKTPEFDIAIDNIDESEWNDMLDAYMDEYVPKFRGPEYVVDLPTKEDSEWYAWEFERDLTQEFVQSVRDGQIDAANDSGITDFVWVAIIDSHTCDDCCGDYGCVDFDGLLTSEIDEMTEGEYSTPSAHFNCRCTLAPATDNIPEKPDDGSQDFEDWLSS